MDKIRPLTKIKPGHWQTKNGEYEFKEGRGKRWFVYGLGGTVGFPETAITPVGHRSLETAIIFMEKYVLPYEDEK